MRHGSTTQPRNRADEAQNVSWLRLTVEIIIRGESCACRLPYGEHPRMRLCFRMGGGGESPRCRRRSNRKSDSSGDAGDGRKTSKRDTILLRQCWGGTQSALRRSCIKQAEGEKEHGGQDFCSIRTPKPLGEQHAPCSHFRRLTALHVKQGVERSRLPVGILPRQETLQACECQTPLVLLTRGSRRPALHNSFSGSCTTTQGSKKKSSEHG